MATRVVLVSTDGRSDLPSDTSKGQAVYSSDFARGLGDAFGRQRVSEPFTLFDSKLTQNAQPLQWDEAQTSGSGTSTAYSSEHARVRMSVGASTAGARVRQTRRHFNYQPGKSQQILMTFVLGAAATGITRRIGQFDANNGIFLQQTSAGLAFVVRKAAADTVVAQADWNGAETITIDPTKAAILIIDYEWLGVGVVRCGFVVDGAIHYCHAFKHAGNVTAVYMSTPVNPLRFEIVNSGTGAAASLDCICSSVISEGGVQNPGTLFGDDRGSTPLVTLNDADIYPLLAIRLENVKAATKLEEFNILCTSTAVIRYMLLLNPTVAGTAFSFTAPTNSVTGVAKPTNATKVSGGTLLRSGYVDQSNTPLAVQNSPQDLSILGSTIAGVSDVLVLAVQRLTGTTETLYGAVTWREVY